MPLSRLYERIVVRTRAQPQTVHYAGAALLAGITLAARALFNPLWGDGFPLVFSGMAVVCAAALFGGRAGILATLLSMAGVAYFYLAPDSNPLAHRGGQLTALLAFGLNGILTSLILETLHRSMTDLRAAEFHRILLLREFRHRARNDLQSLVGLLLLRARSASPEAREALREAAGHARALASVHCRLELANATSENGAFVDTRLFIGGLVADLDPTQADGLRPVAITVDAEAHPIDTERAVTLGLILNETMTNALKYAFPGDDAHGVVAIRFWRTGDRFILAVDDDGIGVDPAQEITPGTPTSQTVGSRLLRGLAAQLRGQFNRHRLDAGGTCCEVRFPVEAPNLRPEAVGSPLPYPDVVAPTWRKPRPAV